MTWNIARNTEKGGKMRNILGRTWNMARVLKIMENEKHTLYDAKYGKKKTMKNVKNEKNTLQDQYYGEKTEIREK